MQDLIGKKVKIVYKDEQQNKAIFGFLKEITTDFFHIECDGKNNLISRAYTVSLREVEQ